MIVVIMPQVQQQHNIIGRSESLGMAGTTAVSAKFPINPIFLFETSYIVYVDLKNEAPSSQNLLTGESAKTWKLTMHLPASSYSGTYSYIR